MHGPRLLEAAPVGSPSACGDGHTSRLPHTAESGEKREHKMLAVLGRHGGWRVLVSQACKGVDHSVAGFTLSGHILTMRPLKGELSEGINEPTHACARQST